VGAAQDFITSHVKQNQNLALRVLLHAPQWPSIHSQIEFVKVIPPVYRSTTEWKIIPIVVRGLSIPSDLFLILYQLTRSNADAISARKEMTHVRLST
jgi:hypothetical protein